MGTAKSRMKKVAPVSVTEDTFGSGGDRDGNQLFGPSNIKTTDRRVSVRRVRADRSSEGQDSEFSAEDLAVEVDRILDECDNTEITLNRTAFRMPVTSGLYYAKRQNGSNVYSGRTHDKNELNKPASNIRDKVRPPKDLLSSSIESTATASGYGVGVGSSLVFPIMYDDSEEDLMNTIERDFG